jgi:hypothetical protein
MHLLRISSKPVPHALLGLCSSSRTHDIFTEIKTAGIHDATMQTVLAGLGSIKNRSDLATSSAAKWKELTA